MGTLCTSGKCCLVGTTGRRGFTMLGGLSASFGRRPQDEEHESACVWRLLTKLGAWGSATLARVQKAEAAAQARPNGGVSSCKVPGMELRALRLQLAIRLEYLGPKVYNTLDIDRTLRCEIPTVLDFQVFELYAGTLPVPSTQLRMSPERFRVTVGASIRA